MKKTTKSKFTAPAVKGNTASTKAPKMVTEDTQPDYMTNVMVMKTVTGLQKYNDMGQETLAFEKGLISSLETGTPYQFAFKPAEDGHTPATSYGYFDHIRKVETDDGLIDFEVHVNLYIDLQTNRFEDVDEMVSLSELASLRKMHVRFSDIRDRKTNFRQYYDSYTFFRFSMNAVDFNIDDCTFAKFSFKDTDRKPVFGFITCATSDGVLELDTVGLSRSGVERHKMQFNANVLRGISREEIVMDIFDGGFKSTGKTTWKAKAAAVEQPVAGSGEEDDPITETSPEA